jgi:hypothetical protein
MLSPELVYVLPVWDQTGLKPNKISSRFCSAASSICCNSSPSTTVSALIPGFQHRSYSPAPAPCHFPHPTQAMSAMELLSSESTSTAPVQYLPEVVAIFDEIVANRRWFHAHPELSFEEVNTAKKIVEILREIGVEEIFEGVGRTGVVALIRGGAEGPCVALRADIDALPVLETSDVEYTSQNKGVMHACGHDGHIAGLLGAARVLWGGRKDLKGVVKLLFQPAEEGYGGAREIIKEGVLEEGMGMGPRVDSVYGIHLWSCK